MADDIDDQIEREQQRRDNLRRTVAPTMAKENLGTSRPKREDYPGGLDGKSQFDRAMDSWQSKNDSAAKDTAQKKALSRMP